MLRINPPTALLLLTDIVALKPGDWVIQNVANSAVGRLLIRLAKARGLRTVNVVRRDSLFAELEALGGDACVVDGPDLAAAVTAKTGGAPIRLGIDAVSGRATARISSCLAEGGVVCNYGSMSGEDPVMSRSALTSGGQTLVGFILGRALATRSLDQVRALYADLGRQLQDGYLSAPVEKIYPIEDIKAGLGARTAGRTQRQDPGRAQRMSASRRQFLAGALAVGAGTLAPWVVRRVGAQPALPDNLFTLGVASGYPLPTGVVLWTRLAPAPLVPGGGMPREAIPVEWEVAADERMSQIVLRGRTAATPEWAHTVHVEVDGLAPARWYWYRFRAGGQASPIGRTRTAPAAIASVDRLRFAFASCQHYEQGFFNAYRTWWPTTSTSSCASATTSTRAPGVATPCASTARPSRTRSTTTGSGTPCTRATPTCKRRTRACPWMVTWDDHEVSNDYADDRSETLHPREWFLERRAAAYRAYYEHMPLRRQMVPFGPHMRLYHRAAFGDLVQFHVLDDRQYRSHQACPPPGRGGSTLVEDCADRLAPERTMLGATQEQWLATGLDRSRARWNVLAQQTLMAQLDRQAGPGAAVLDGWVGRLSIRAAPSARVSRSAEGEQPHRHRRRRALVLGDRPQAGLRRPALTGGGDGVRRHLDHVAVRTPAGAGRPAAPRQFAYPPGERLAARIRAHGGDAGAAARRSAHDAHRRPADERGGHAGQLRRRGRPARSDPSLGR